MSRQWLRAFELAAGMVGSTGFLVGSEVEGRALHINFSLEKSDSQESNTGNITISNLNDQHKATLSEKDCYVNLKAGYKGNVNTIFAGWVSDSSEEISGGDRNLKIEVIDGLLTTSYQGIISLSGTVKGTQILEKIEAGLEVESVIVTDAAAKLLASAKYENGYAFVGMYREALQKLCQKAGVTYSLQNGVLQIFVSGEAVTTSAYLLSADTGLISIPAKITITDSESSSSDSSSSTETGIPGYEVEYFINPAIGINDLVRLETKTMTGYYRVHKQTYTGDNYTGDWLCKAQLIEVTEG